MVSSATCFCSSSAVACCTAAFAWATERSTSSRRSTHAPLGPPPCWGVGMRGVIDPGPAAVRGGGWVGQAVGSPPTKDPCRGQSCA